MLNVNYLMSGKSLMQIHVDLSNEMDAVFNFFDRRIKNKCPNRSD